MLTVLLGSNPKSSNRNTCADYYLDFKIFLRYYLDIEIINSQNTRKGRYPMSQDSLKLVIALARAHTALFGRIEKNVQSFGLTTSEFGVLELLYHKGDQAVQAVAEKILVTSGTVTYVIDKLQKKGLVLRRQCETDRRVFYVTLTEAGQTLIAEIFPQHEQFLDDLFQGIAAADKQQLIRQLALVKTVIDRKEGSPDDPQT